MLLIFFFFLIFFLFFFAESQNLSKKFGTQVNEFWDNPYSDIMYSENFPAYVEDYFEKQESKGGFSMEPMPGRIQCLPLPGE